MKCVILFCLILLQSVGINTSFINLFQKFHFYELSIENNNEIKNQDSNQLFGNKIYGEGKWFRINKCWSGFKLA